MSKKLGVKQCLSVVLLLILLESFSKCIHSQSTARIKATSENDVSNCKQCMVLCEQSQNRIVIVEVPSKKVLWEWKAISSNVAAEHREWFNFPDEAKTVYNNKYILITASGGGIALIRISDKKVVFYAYAGGNPHSAEILPDGNIVSSSSTGNFLTLFKVDTINFPKDLFFKSYPIKDGHNVVWDKKRQVLWAGSGTQLYSYKYNFSCNEPELKLSDSLGLPDNLHDLFPTYNEDALWLTTDAEVMKLRLADKQFEPGLMKQSKNIKSVSSGAVGQATIIIHPKEKWWTDAVLNSQGETLFTQPGLKIYKARWMLVNTFSYPSDHEIKICP